MDVIWKKMIFNLKCTVWKASEKDEQNIQFYTGFHFFAVRSITLIEKSNFQQLTIRVIARWAVFSKET